MVAKQRNARVTAAIVIVLIVAVLVGWEVWFGGGTAEDGVREVAVILKGDEPFPPVMYVEKDVDYYVAITTGDEVRSLEDWPGELDGDGPPEVWADEIVHIRIPAGQLKDGERLGSDGPLIRVVHNLDDLAAKGEVYYAAVIAAEEGLIPRQLPLTEGMRVSLGGTSIDIPRMLLVEGARFHLPLYPASITELLVDVPTEGTYNVVCEQGCADSRWRGAFRVRSIDSEVPWVEAKDTDAAPELHRRAPDFALYDVDGQVVQLSDFKGEKPVFINFWATWCPPCRREMPAMQRLHEQQGDEVHILAVNYLESRAQVTAFLDEMQLDFPVLMDVRGDVNGRYGIWSYPTSLFVDRDGVVRGRFIGELTSEMMEEFVAVITE